MIPILTPSEMAEVDRKANEPVEVLIDRAGYSVARAARRLIAGCYGRRIVVVAGRGNNGADGRAAARVLEAWGARVWVLEAAEAGHTKALPPADLVVDAAYGTGLSRPYVPPDPGDAPVLAVDIPSGLSGITGLPVAVEDGSGAALRASRTVTFASYKPGLLVGDGPDYAGEVEVADIGLGRLVDPAAFAWLVTDDDVRHRLAARRRNAHKWQTSVQVVAGSPDMYGAPLLVAHGAMRAGAGYARVGIPGGAPGGGLPPGEYVTHRLPVDGWDAELADAIGRVRALVIGPGLGDPAGGVGKGSAVARLLVAAEEVPAVVDADGLKALADLDTVAAVARGRRAEVVLTPHEGEYTRLTGHPPAEDRLSDVRGAASRARAVVLLKGSPTVVAHPDGRVFVVNSGSPRLATAGTGDVLSGAIGAFMARGMPAMEAAAFAAHAHGRAAGIGAKDGLVASDLPVLISRWLSEISG